MTTPAVRAIRKDFPAARISLLAKPWVAPVFSQSPHVDRILIYDGAGRHRGISGKIRLARELRAHRFDGAILLQNAFEAALIAFLAGIPTRIGFDTDGRKPFLTHPVACTPAIKRIHQTGYYLEILKGMGLETDGDFLELTLNSADRARAREMLRERGISPGERMVGINPSATFGPAKQWFPDRYAALADRIRTAYGARILIFGGPADRALGEKIAGMMNRSAVNLAGETRLEEAMALIACCDLFVTNDSGLMHVAAAQDVPLIAIFGSTNPVTTGPHSRRSRIVRAELPCSPCLKPYCPEGHLHCMTRIDVDAVFSVVEEML